MGVPRVLVDVSRSMHEYLIDSCVVYDMTEQHSSSRVLVAMMKAIIVCVLASVALVAASNNGFLISVRNVADTPIQFMVLIHSSSYTSMQSVTSPYHISSK
jgi:hypothetical protein